MATRAALGLRMNKACLDLCKNFAIKSASQLHQNTVMHSLYDPTEAGSSDRKRRILSLHNFRPSNHASESYRLSTACEHKTGVNLFQSRIRVRTLGDRDESLSKELTFPSSSCVFASTCAYVSFSTWPS